MSTQCCEGGGVCEVAILPVYWQVGAAGKDRVHTLGDSSVCAVLLSYSEWIAMALRQEVHSLL